MTESTAATAAIEAPLPRAKRGWSGVVSSVFLCPFRPATAARRTLDGPLRRAYLVHVLSAAAIVVIVLSVIAVFEAGPSVSLREWVDQLRHIFGGFLGEFVENPLPMFVAAAAIELGYAALAWLFIAWGARDEPIRASLAHSLRRVWMQTPQLALFLIIICSAVGVVENANQGWDESHPIPSPQMPVQPAGIQQNTPQWDKYVADMQAYYDEVNRIQSERHATQPWYIRHADVFVAIGGFGFGLIFLSSILRSVGVARVGPRVDRSPHCEACGYNLTTMPMEGRCPECGEPVEASLGAAARPGPPWVHQQRGAAPRWAPTWKGAIFSPTAFGRTLKTIDPGTGHRRFLALHLPIVFLIGAVAPLLAYRAIEGRFPVPKDTEFYFVLPSGGILCVVGVIAMSLKFAAWTGWYFWWRDKRNLLAAAIQATCYLTPFLVAWQFCGGALGILAMSLSRNPDRLPFAKSIPIHLDVLLLNGWMIFNFVWLAVYIQLVRRIVAATRYANK